MVTKRDIIFSRVDPELRERVREGASRHFHGNESMFMRDAAITYLDLRDALGTSFDAVVSGLRHRAEPTSTKTQEQAA